MTSLGFESGNRLPRHIAVIMDGNGRWARTRNRPRSYGHQQGVEAARRLVEACIQRDIPHLTLFAFGQENWKRPKEEVGFLMRTFYSVIGREVRKMGENGVRFSVIGDRSALDDALLSQIVKAETETAHHTRLRLNLAINYSGRWDIINAYRQCVESAHEPKNAADFESHLSLSDQPPPDLLIRTGCEQRLSNFLLWQFAYTELYFPAIYWPDFDEEALDAALNDYVQRQRRYGRTPEQVEACDE